MTLGERSFAVAVNPENGDVVITMSDGTMHACMSFDAEEFAGIVPMVNGAFGDSKMASS